MHSLSRRDFLKALCVVTSGTFLHPQWMLDTGDKSIAVPPTLMLHSKDRWKLVNILAWLKDNGYNSVTYRQLIAVIKGEAKLPSRPVILTIDDIGTAFIVTYYLDMIDMIEKAGFIGMLGLVTAKTPSETPAIWKTLREMSDRGWQLDTHTTHHHVLPQLDTLDELRVEIVDSAKMVEDGIGKAPTSLIVPYANVGYSNGKYDERIFKVSAEANLDFVVGMAHGRVVNTDQPPIYLGRVGVGVDSVQTGYWLQHFNIDSP